jgi:hypothetical protein
MWQIYTIMLRACMRACKDDGDLVNLSRRALHGGVISSFHHLRLLPFSFLSMDRSNAMEHMGSTINGDDGDMHLAIFG